MATIYRSTGTEMVTCPPNDVLLSSLFRSSSTSTHHRSHFRLWGSSFPRKILNSVRCGVGSSSRRCRSSGVAPDHLHSSPSKRPPDSESGFVKLSDLFRRSSQLESEDFVTGGGGADGEKTVSSRSSLRRLGCYRGRRFKREKTVE